MLGELYGDEIDGMDFGSKQIGKQNDFNGEQLASGPVSSTISPLRQVKYHDEAMQIEGLDGQDMAQFALDRNRLIQTLQQNGNQMHDYGDIAAQL